MKKLLMETSYPSNWGGKKKKVISELKYYSLANKIKFNFKHKKTQENKTGNSPIVYDGSS